MPIYEIRQVGSRLGQHAVRNIRTIHLVREAWHRITGDEVSTETS